MTARFATVVLGALSTLGCADMLGLGGLTFDQQATGGAAPTLGSGGSGVVVGGSGGSPGGSGGGDVILGSGGQPGPPSQFTGDYPMTLSPGGTLIATWPGFGDSRNDENGTFWVYAPELGTLSAQRLDLAYPDELGISEVPGEWDLVYAPTLHDVTWLFGYDEPTGLFDYGPAPTPGEAFESDLRAGSPGWTHLVLAGDPEAPFVVAADRLTGIVRVGPADPTLEDPEVTSTVWASAFTDLVAFQLDGVDGVARLHNVLGTAEFVPIEDGELGEAVWLGYFAPNWTSAVSYAGKEGATLLLYHADNGAVEVYYPSGNAESALWQRDVTGLVTVLGGGEPWAVTYDGATGVTDLHQLDPLVDSVVVK